MKRWFSKIQTKVLLFSFVIASFTFANGQSLEINNEINDLLDSWHQAASEADYEQYFSKMTTDSHFLGTDATENWAYSDFMSFSKPYFDRGKAWSFTVVNRNISYKNQVVWFDEILQTQMGLCRGSGVCVLDGHKWKIAHYVLSILVPNEHVDELLKIKKQKDSLLLHTTFKPPMD